MIPHHTFPNHNGGDLVIGPDNMLYIGVGDGGGGGDSQRQRAEHRRAARQDPAHRSRARTARAVPIPADNPFAGQAGKRGEIWMYGLRNPWRFSFDRKTHDMWIGDVGQDLYEEIDFAPAGRRRASTGAGTSAKASTRTTAAPSRPGAHDPILERPHTAGDCAIIGGYVYRGAPNIPLGGAYVFGDECTGVVRAIVQSGGKVTAECRPAPERVAAHVVRPGSRAGSTRPLARRLDLPCSPPA